MEKNIKSLLFINVASFIFLICIWNFTNDRCLLNKCLDEYRNHDKKLCRKTFRLLANCKGDNYSAMIGLKEEMPNNTVKEKKDIYIYENEPKKEMKQTNRNLLCTYVENKQDMKNKSCIFETRKYSRLEKKIFKELDYEDFLKNNRNISDKLYKKIMRKKCGKRFSLPLLLLSLLLVSLILDLSCDFGLVRGLYKVIYHFSPPVSRPFGTSVKIVISPFIRSLYDSLTNSPFKWLFDKVVLVKNSRYVNYCVSNFFSFIIYVIPFIILGATLILALVYYHKKVKKFEKIKFRKR
ncbi:fam-l protein [Plasmodium malariae]|uniref:Fam-l protein n=1 Tax=Plasmodium malariae TaxID=5858 RepID=A0A1D3JHR6_PLAMA|nr:fam-l protein [Plasmodium malariae]SBT85895.1 fam-l protein [Plasmodium malariae]